MLKVTQIISMGKADLIDLLDDKTIYGISQSVFEGKYHINPLSECEIGKLLNGEITLVKIEKDL